jgi:hypothetical protein
MLQVPGPLHDSAGPARERVSEWSVATVHARLLIIDGIRGDDDGGDGGGDDSDGRG